MAEQNSLGGDVKVEQQPTEQQDEGKKGSKFLVPFYRLFSFADSLDCALMLLGTVSAVGNGITLPFMTIIFGELLDSFGGAADTKYVLHNVSKVSLKFVYLALGSGVASFLQLACWMVTGERQAARIRSLYLETILRQDIGFFDLETNTGEIIGRMSGDIVLIQGAMGEKVGQFVQSVATFIAGFVVAFIKGWLITLVMISSIPPLILSGAIMTTIVAKMSARGQSAYSFASTVVAQTISSIRTVASFTGERLAIAKYNGSLKKAYDSGVQEGLATGFGFGVIMFVVLCTYSLALWFGGKMVIEKGYTGGDVVNIIFSVLIGSMAMGQASPCLSTFAAGQVAAYKMFEAINRKPVIDSYDTKGLQLDNIQGDIELRDVYFSYPARPDELILNGLSLSISHGTNLALVGESGSGKSTVISLIERFYDPQAGEVLIDGINLKDFQLKWIRQKIGLVSQEPVLFASTIRENISYAKEGPTDEEIKAAVEMANAAKFIDNLPQGLDTMVGEHGTQLSGGQKQRIAIARAILKDPRILLLDEATSALDAESERIVQEALDRIMVKRTTVIVAHRLSTVRNADTIAVIHQGKLIEKGSHVELTRDPDGAYSQLIRLQELKPEPERSLIFDQERPEIVIDSGRHSRSLIFDQERPEIVIDSGRHSRSLIFDQERPEIVIDSGRHSSRRVSFLRSISHGSSGVGNSSRHSFSLFGVSTGIIIAPEEKPHESFPEKPQEISEFPFWRLAALNSPEIPVLVVGSIAAVAAGMIFPVFGILLSNIIKTFYEPRDEIRKDSRFWALMFFMLALSCLLVHPLKSYLFSIAGCKLIRRVREMCFKKVVYMEISWFDEAENSSGIVGSRLSADAASLRGLVGDALALLVQNVATIVAGIAIAFEANWQLALIILALIPVVGVNGFVQVKFIQGFSADAEKLYQEASQVAIEAIGAIRTVASFCTEDRVMVLYKQKCRGPIRTGIKQGLISGSFFGLSFLLLYSVYACCFYAAARLINDGKTTFSEVFQVFFTLAMTAWSISQSSSFVPDSSKAKCSAASVFAILDQKSKIDASDNSGTTLENVKGHIEFYHVSFRYPTRPEVQIFQDLCLTIRSGKTVALVGESGSGKSTVISLLQRFYDPDSGQITLDGVDIQKLQLKWMRQQVGLVGQETVLFNDMIRANIAYGKEGNATEAEILAAAETANAHNFISGLQHGYDTMVGERGVQLSGGQKQRVAIARAIVKSPKILLLDEATSALDAESERVVQDALDQVMVSRTTIVVAHRLTTIKGADLIAVVKNGVIAEKGKHEALMGIKDGIYASLVALHSSNPS